MSAVDVVRKLLELNASGLVSSDVFEKMLNGISLEIKTPRITGVYKDGMLEAGGSLYSLNVGGMLGCKVLEPQALKETLNKPVTTTQRALPKPEVAKPEVKPVAKPEVAKTTPPKSD